MSFAFLTGNMLKILAAISMTIDHIGLLLLPQFLLLRVLGRLAMPIFAFMIAEGCKYTRNRRKYFGTVFGLGVVCQAAYYLFDGSLYFSILITFSLAILMVYALDFCKMKKTPASFLVFAGAVVSVYGLNQIAEIDYGFWGCMLPVFAALPHGTRWDRSAVSIGCLGLGLILLSGSFGFIQWYSLLAIPVLLCYNGKRGKANLKYFFYIFYPAHLVILEGIAMLIDSL